MAATRPRTKSTKAATPSLKRKRSNLVTAKSSDDNKAKVLRHLKETLGVVLYACERTGIATKTFYRYLQTDAEFAESVRDIQEGQIDFVEKKLLEAVNDKNPASIIFYLKTKAKHRGYVERVEHTGANGQAIQHNNAVTIADKREMMPEDALATTVARLLQRNPALLDRIQKGQTA